jgi:DDE superfamily endonuclease
MLTCMCRFERGLMAQYDEVDFKRHLRANRSTFQMLVTDLGHILKRQDTVMKKAIPVDKRVAVALFHYAHDTSTYFLTGDKFGISEAAAHGMVFDFIDAVIKVYSDRISFPAGDSLHEVIKRFERKYKFPNCCGAIDCTHILITTPTIDCCKCYYDRNSNMSVILQAVVDSSCRFIDVHAGRPGCTNDARVFSESPLAEALRQGTFLQEPVVQVQGCNVKPYIVGDAGYKLEKYIMIPYPSSQLSDEARKSYNFFQSCTRNIVEQAFGRLKGRFRWLNGIVAVRSVLEHAGIIFCACMLHNIMIDEMDEPLAEWGESESSSDEDSDEESGDHGLDLMTGDDIVPGESDLEASAIRDILCSYTFGKNGPAPKE